MSDVFSQRLASQFSSIGEISALSKSTSPLSRLSTSDLGGILARPIDRPILERPPIDGPPPRPIPDPVPPPLTPTDAGTFIDTVAEGAAEQIAAAVHAARV